MEAKLLAQLRMCMDELLFMVFIDLKKAYYSLHRGRCLQILRRYGVGENVCRLLKAVWENDVLC